MAPHALHDDLRGLGLRTGARLDGAVGGAEVPVDLRQREAELVAEDEALVREQGLAGEVESHRLERAELRTGGVASALVDLPALLVNGGHADFLQVNAGGVEGLAVAAEVLARGCGGLTRVEELVDARRRHGRGAVHKEDRDAGDLLGVCLIGRDGVLVL